MMKAIIFEIDNTLIDFVSMKQAAPTVEAITMIEAGLQDAPKRPL
jgi:FMN phosphatase YigB (HAD superfamily)